MELSGLHDDHNPANHDNVFPPEYDEVPRESIVVSFEILLTKASFPPQSLHCDRPSVVAHLP
jgi:hypothetical protein